jgi:hypothetical protein
MLHVSMRVHACVRAQVPNGPIHHPRGKVVSDPQVTHNEVLVTYDLPAAPLPLRQTRPAAKFPATANSGAWLRYGAPVLGEHTAEILLERGWSEEEVGQLLAKGVVRGIWMSAQPHLTSACLAAPHARGPSLARRPGLRGAVDRQGRGAQAFRELPARARARGVLACWSQVTRCLLPRPQVMQGAVRPVDASRAADPSKRTVNSG